MITVVMKKEFVDLVHVKISCMSWLIESINPFKTIWFCTLVREVFIQLWICKNSRKMHCVVFHSMAHCHGLRCWNSVPIMRAMYMYTHTVSFPELCKLLAVDEFYLTHDSTRPSCESTVLIVGANLQAMALPEAYGVIRTSTEVVTYLVTNSVWHEARWEMGRKEESVDRPLKCVPKPIHLTAKEEEDRQKECDDKVWRMYVDHRRRKWTRDTAANRAILYRAICIYRATVSVLPC